MNFYTSVNARGNSLFISGYRDGKRFKEKVKYSPYLFIPTEAKTDYKTIHGDHVKRVDFDTMGEARAWAKQRKSLSNTKTYGMTDFQYTYIYDTYPGEIEFDFKALNVVSLDIENDSEGGFADIDQADKEITMITLSKEGNKSVTVGFVDYPLDTSDRVYIKCRNEVELLNKFLIIWNSRQWRPDIITGWNIRGYDIRYIVNRMKRVLPRDEYLKLSPFKIIEEETVTPRNSGGKSFQTYNFVGINTLDYLELYRKFAMGEREKYTLDYIAEYELKERKIDYSKYGSLAKLYKENPELFTTYNIQDALLINRLEDKLHYIEQAVTMAYIIKVNFSNILKTVKPWDVLVHNYLMDRGIVVPFFEDSDTDETIIGGYCKEPIPGKYEYVMSLDFTSLYPSIAMTFNISPDTFVKQSKGFDKQIILTGDMTKYTEALLERNYALTANGCFFRRENKGFIPDIMSYFFSERKRFRKLEAEAKKESEANPGDTIKKNIFLKYKNIQTAYKLLNNSGYGAIANQYFRWFANPLAEGITSTGQIASQYVAIHLNAFLNEKFGTDDIDYIIYQDTDSAYVNLQTYAATLNGKDNIIKDLVDYTESVIQPKVDEFCKNFCDTLNAYENHLSMKLEKVCDKAFFIRKKRYALNVAFDEGIYNSKSKLKVTGLETVRSSVPKVTRDAMTEIFKMIFAGDQEGIYAFIDNFKEKFYKMNFEQIAVPTSCNGLYSHMNSGDGNLWVKGTPVHVKGGIIYNHWLKEKKLDRIYEVIYDHDKVKYCYLNPENPTRQGVISIKGTPPPELEIEKFIDYDHMWEKTFMAPIQTICDVVRINTEDILTLYDVF